MRMAPRILAVKVIHGKGGREGKEAASEVETLDRAKRASAPMPPPTKTARQSEKDMGG